MESSKQENKMEMQNIEEKGSTPRPDDAAQAAIAFTSYQGHVAEGVVTSVYNGRRYAFQGLDQLFLLMEDIMDFAGYPQGAYVYRSLSGKPFRMLQDLEEEWPEGNGSKAHAKVLLRVYYRQHASWQGEVRAMGPGGPATVRFRSAIELMRILHGYLEAQMGTGT